MILKHLNTFIRRPLILPGEERQTGKFLLVKRVLLALFFGVFWINPALSQGLVEIIQKTQKAVIQGVTYDSNGYSTDSVMGFFISADGLAITPTSGWQYGDSIQFTDHTGTKLSIHKIIALHPYAGLALVQLSTWNEQKHTYLTPTNTPAPVNRNILVFGNPEDHNEGLFYTQAGRAFFQLFIRRGTFVAAQLPQSLHGAPVLNETGRFSGILFHLPAFNEPVLLPLSLLDDTLWRSIDLPYEEFLASRQKIPDAQQGIVQGLLYQITGHWIESAKAFSSYLKMSPEKADLYALRAISRLNYDNQLGCREDIEQAFAIDKASSLAAYANALSYMHQQLYKEADDQLRLALGTNPAFALAFLELGKLQVASNNIKEAYISFSKAAEADSMLAEAFYEKARLTQLHSPEPNTALEDLQKAAQLDPNLPGVFSLMGNSKITSHDYLEAIRYFNQAINLDPNDGHAYINRGMAWFNVGMKENACKDWELAGKVGMPQAFKLLSRHCSELRKSFLQNR